MLFCDRAVLTVGKQQTISAFLSHTHEPAHDFLSKVAHSGTPHDALVADILGFAVTTSVPIAKSS